MIAVFRILLVFVAFLPAAPAQGQYPQERSASVGTSPSVRTPGIGIKTNLLYDMTLSMNLGLEVKTGARHTLDMSGSYHPWTFGKNKRMKHFLVQPEFRHWFCEAFNGHFLGVHGLYGQYSVGGINFPFIDKNKRYEGDMYGGGASYGYQWIIAPRLNLEAAVGVGYVYFAYKTYECRTCGEELGDGSRHYFGPTKVGLSLIYTLK